VKVVRKNLEIFLAQTEQKSQIRRARVNFVAFGVIPENGRAKVESEHFSSGQKIKGQSSGRYEHPIFSFNRVDLSVLSYNSDIFYLST
jgi:hypothetical protein